MTRWMISQHSWSKVRIILFRGLLNPYKITLTSVKERGEMADFFPYFCSWNHYLIYGMWPSKIKKVRSFTSLRVTAIRLGNDLKENLDFGKIAGR
jgi:hypothetical protein